MPEGTADSTSYDLFAPFYDAFTSGSDYDAWTSHVLALADEYGLAGRKLLDLACGTGNSFVPFLQAGFEVTGCDASAAMLAEAARKAPTANLVHADVRELPTLDRFHLVTCFDDSLNYLSEERDLASAFGSMAANLHREGLVMFDLNTLLAYRTTFATDSVSAHGDVIFAWRGASRGDAAPGCRADASIEIFAPRERGLYERVTSVHAQRHFPREQVLAALRRAGLACAGVHGVLADGALVPDADELRQLKVLYVARPAEGGVHK
jgi:SAM-dependent methyltransferase